jgi:hypothetical protein
MLSDFVFSPRPEKFIFIYADIRMLKEKKSMIHIRHQQDDEKDVEPRSRDMMALKALLLETIFQDKLSGNVLFWQDERIFLRLDYLSESM